jgi:hypothetical protein
MVLPYHVERAAFQGVPVKGLLIRGLHHTEEWNNELSSQYYREHLGYYLDPFEAVAFLDTFWKKRGLDIYLVRRDKPVWLLRVEYEHSFAVFRDEDDHVARLARSLGQPHLFRLYSIACL